MTDASMMEADCIHGVAWYDCAACDEAMTHDRASFIDYDPAEAARNAAIRECIKALEDWWPDPDSPYREPEEVLRALLSADEKEPTDDPR